LLDIDMPEIFGFEAMEIFKASSSNSQIPVIFLTSMEGERIIDKTI